MGEKASTRNGKISRQNKTDRRKKKKKGENWKKKTQLEYDQGKNTKNFRNETYNKYE